MNDEDEVVGRLTSYSATHPIRLTPYKITPPYFQPKNAQIIDPTFWVG